MPGKTVTVKNAVELAAAIKAASGGETILLAAGDYGDVVIKGRMMASTVTIKSADPNHDALLTGLRIDRSANFTFEDLDVKHLLGKDEGNWTAAIEFTNSSRIALNGIDVSGSMDNNPFNDGVGMRITGGTNIMVTNSTFEQLKTGAVFSRISGLVVSNNSVTQSREGFDFNAVHHVLVEKNQVSNIIADWAAGDHPDAFQFWNNGVNEGSSDVIIRNNVILTTSGNQVQGIFIRAENLAYHHSDFLIENNLYNGDARSGIALSGVDNAVIRGNTLVTTAGGKLETAIRLDDSSHILVDHNISPLLLQYRSSDVTVSNHIDVWDSVQKKGVSMASLFSDSSPGKFDQGDFALNAHGSAAQLGAGFHAVADVGISKLGLAAAYATYSTMLDGNVATMHLV